MIANSRCIACILSKQERKIRKNSDEQKKKEYIHKVLKILYEYGTKECAPMVEKRIKDIYKEYYEEDVDYVALKHRYNQYMLEKEEEIRAHIQKNKIFFQTQHNFMYMCIYSMYTWYGQTLKQKYSIEPAFVLLYNCISPRIYIRITLFLLRKVSFLQTNFPLFLVKKG